MPTLDESILACLSETEWMKACEIAKRLGKPKSEINSRLYRMQAVVYRDGERPYWKKVAMGTIV